MLEGVGYALRSMLDVFAENGQPLPSLRVLGGGSKSDLWRTILAGIYDRRLQTVADVGAATSLGAAMAAGVGAGLWSWDQAARLVRVVREETPDPVLVAAYAPRYAFSQTLYPVLRERFAALARL